MQEKEATVTIPSSIFRDRNLAPLESITEYLKEEQGLSYHEIAVLVGRDDRTIWTCYNRAQKKRIVNPKPLHEKAESLDIPINIFKNRTFAPLEAISLFLKETANLSFHEIAVLVGRDDRTIWTCNNRAKKKLSGVNPSG